MEQQILQELESAAKIILVSMQLTYFNHSLQFSDAIYSFLGTTLRSY